MRSFCPACGTHIFSAPEERPQMVVIRAGTLDDPEIAAPSGAIWVASAPSSACIDPALERWQGRWCRRRWRNEIVIRQLQPRIGV